MKRTKLPHIDLEEHYQFITFRTYDSLDGYLEKIYASEQENSKKQMLADDHLDSSTQGAYLFDKKIDIFKNTLLKRDNDLYELIAFAIMPNHIHLLLKQKKSLVSIIKYIKGKSAIELNKALGRNGQFWARDYYDRAIRNEAHFSTVYAYILNNPLKANLTDAKERVYGKYE